MIRTLYVVAGWALGFAAGAGLAAPGLAGADVSSGAPVESARGGTGIAIEVSALDWAPATPGHASASTTTAANDVRRAGRGTAMLKGALPLMTASPSLAMPESPGDFAACGPVAERLARVDHLAAAPMRGVDREPPRVEPEAHRPVLAERSPERHTAAPGPGVHRIQPDRDRAHRPRRLDCDLVRVVADAKPAAMSSHPDPGSPGLGEPGFPHQLQAGHVHLRGGAQVADRLRGSGPPQLQAGREPPPAREAGQAPTEPRGGVPLVIGQSRIELSTSGEERERDPASRTPARGFRERLGRGGGVARIVRGLGRSGAGNLGEREAHAQDPRGGHAGGASGSGAESIRAAGAHQSGLGPVIVSGRPTGSTWYCTEPNGITCSESPPPGSSIRAAEPRSQTRDTRTGAPPVPIVAGTVPENEKSNGWMR